MPTSLVKQHALFYCRNPTDPDRSFVLPERTISSDGEFAIPPRDYTEYNEKPEYHLSSGHEMSETLRGILANGGFDIGKCKRFLEFGCSNGRVLRHFKDWASVSQGYGVDMNAMTLLWAMQNLRPPFRFAVTSETPHLPFADEFFGLVYAISIFTHIDDLFPAWLAELARVTEPNGYVFFTIHDEVGTVPALKEGFGTRLSEILTANPHYERFAAGEIAMLAIEVGAWGLLPFFKRSFFLEIMSEWFDIISVTDRANVNHQTGILGKRRPL